MSAVYFTDIHVYPNAKILSGGTDLSLEVTKFRKDIKNRTEKNTEVINIRQNRQHMIQCRKYDPLNYNGLNTY